MARVFIAGPFDAKPRIREAARRLEAAGYIICSNWHKEEHDDYALHEELGRREAARDITDIHSCDVFIQDTLTPSTHGSSHAEWGLSLARTNRRFLVGPVVMVYHHFAYRRFWNWDEAIEWFTTPHGR